MKRFEEIPHTADWSFRAFGSDLRNLFENAAFAMFSLEGAIPPETNTYLPNVTRQVTASGGDDETLLVNWLNELLYLQDTQHETYSRFQIEELAANSLKARVQGTRNAHIDKLIKAATFHNLRIEQTQDGWEAVVVVDV